MSATPFIELHIWGNPQVVARQLGPRMRFLSTVGPRELASWTVVARQPLPPTCVGFHLEGPYLNPAMAGALARRACVTRVWTREVAALVEAGGGRVRMMTIAPELPGAIAAIRWLRRRGIVASLGHTNATYDEARRAIDAGATSATHFFNRMRPWHHREPGVIGAVLDDARVRIQLVLDGIHVHAAAFRLALHAAGPRRLLLTTDSRRADAAAYGLRRRGAAYYLPDGTLAGSALSLPQAIRRAMAWGGLSYAQARAMAGAQPAHLLGIV